ncbi:MAG: class I SAM-dependent methyltransferase [Patescibacteria group bacterium]
MSPLCDLCGGTAFKKEYEGLRDSALTAEGVFAIEKCNQCGLIRLSPLPEISQVAEGYAGNYVPYRKNNFFIHAVRSFLQGRERRILKKYASSAGSILEVGCANGEFLASFGCDGKKLLGIEMDTRSADRARKDFGLSMFVGVFEKFNPVGNELFNLIIMRYVLEHFVSPREALQKAHMLLSSGGFLYVSIPNYDSIERRVFGRYWHGFDVPRHLYVFTEATIHRYASEIDFEVVSTAYDFVPNDWICSIQRWLKEKGVGSLASFFTYKNPLLIIIFLPLSALSCIMGSSSRFAFILKKI